MLLSNWGLRVLKCIKGDSSPTIFPSSSSALTSTTTHKDILVPHLTSSSYRPDSKPFNGRTRTAKKLKNMPSVKSTVMAAAVAFLTVTEAHMKLATPKPYGASSLNNSPLDASGSDFPCKQRPGVYDADGASNTMPIGAPQTLSFIGSAVHGGGSCQISLTKDQKPTKSSKWMVIHSIEGGCPASAAGNLPEDPNGNGAAKFTYTIPNSIDAGQYTLAWTWFNKIGNREMYMNCAPVTVTGGSKKRDTDSEDYFNATEVSSDELFGKRDTSFPDMFTANIGNGCKTVDSKDLKFPNPGSSLETGPGASLSPPTGTCAGGSGSSSGSSDASASGSSGAGTGSGSGSSSAAPSASSVVAIPPAGAPSVGSSGPSVDGGSGASPSSGSGTSGGSSGSSSAAAPSAAAPSAASSASASGSGSTGTASSGNGSASTGSTGSSGGSAAGPSSQACSSPGQLVCSSDGSSFGTCDTNSKAVMMPVAAGTTCSNGAIAAKGAKRSARFAHGYVRRNEPLIW